MILTINSLFTRPRKGVLSCLLYVAKLLLLLLILIALLLALFKTWQNWDDDPARGALVLKDNHFGDTFDKVYPDPAKPEDLNWQNWSPEDSMWFYTTTQGSDLIPYDFFMVLKQKGSDELVRANANMDKFRYIPLKKTFSNPDGLPVGFVKDSYRGKDYVGFTCAACHTAQINYNNVAMRIDGGPALADMESFIISISDSLNELETDTSKRQQFIKDVLDRNGFKAMLSGGRNFSSEKEVDAELNKFISRIADYRSMNSSHVNADYTGQRLEYGYGRLDAFGRIYNRTLQHVLNREEVEKALATVLTPAELRVALEGISDGVFSEGDFDHVMERIKPFVPVDKMQSLRARLFNSPNAPVSYPFLWDIAQHDYVQWNGIAANAGVGPLGRNTGEVIGVFGTLDWEEKEGFTLASIIGKQIGFSKHVQYNSSVNAHNLQRLESHLKTLQSPVWPEEILGSIDTAMAARGAGHYKEYCMGCHAIIKRDDPNRRIVGQFENIKSVGTDPRMATNALTYTGRSGITKHQYQGMNNVGSLLIEEEMPAAVLLTAVTANVVATPDPDKWAIRRGIEWAYNLAATYVTNDIKSSLKRGNYEADSNANPFNSLLAYKARPLNGIWATAPYLHNGSVPTLYDLIQPSADKRPARFYVGGREFDVDKVGFVENEKGSLFDTSLPGNSNAGHIYGEKMSDEERMELLEYLKTL